MSKAKSLKNRYKEEEKTDFELFKSIRGSWDGLDPTSKIFKDKTKYDRKQKYKKKREDYEDSDYS